MRPNIRFIALAALIALSACSRGDDGESAEDYAARMAGAQKAGVSGRDLNLPKVAENGREALSYANAYVQTAPDGTKQGLTINEDGTFVLLENGRTIKGRYQWLPDGKRLRLLGVEFRPIVMVADGVIYRMTNEDVPLDDTAPERMFSPEG